MRSNRTFVFLCLAIVCTASASEIEPKAASAGIWNAAFRYRFEFVDDDALVLAAHANTARLRLGWQKAFAGVSLKIEGEGVAELNSAFNSTANRRAAYPVVADARALELNQAALAWQMAGASLVLGRHAIALDNQRFIGNVAWRHNEQTFDALRIDRNLSDALSLRYAFLDRVHRVNGDSAIDKLARERNLAAHLINTSYVSTLGILTGYGYFLRDQNQASASTQTLGLRWNAGTKVLPANFGLTTELAQQRSYKNNPANFSHRYILLEPSLLHAGITLRLGYECLGGNGTSALQTPLATLHAFNGWADKFVTTPALGLQDYYLSANAKFGSGRLQNQLNWTLAYHDYRASESSVKFGTELNAALGVNLGQGWSALIKIADYQADRFARDTQKIWLQAEWVR